MRKLFFFLLLSITLLSLKEVKAQFYIGGGADFSFFHLQELDNVIDRYNQTQGNTMLNKLENVDYLLGPMAMLGNVSANGFTFEVSWKSSLARRESRYSKNSDVYERQVRVRYHEVGPGLGYTFLKLGAFRPSFLGFINAGTIAELTKSGLSSDIGSVDFTRVDRQFHLGFTLMAQIMIAGENAPIGLSIRPYYHLGFLKIDHSKLNEAINDINQNGTEEYEDNNNYFGLQLALLFKTKG